MLILYMDCVASEEANEPNDFSNTSKMTDWDPSRMKARIARAHTPQNGFAVFGLFAISAITSVPSTSISRPPDSGEISQNGHRPRSDQADDDIQVIA